MGQFESTFCDYILHTDVEFGYDLLGCDLSVCLNDFQYFFSLTSVIHNIFCLQDYQVLVIVALHTIL